MSPARINDGGSAFPVQNLSQNQSTGETTVYEAFGGMSLRDYFAAKAMQAEMITTFSDATPEAAEAFAVAAARAGRSPEAHLAFNAYMLADAMLKARSA